MFSKDKPALLFSALSIVFAFLSVVSVMARLRSHDFKVPVQYVVNDGSVLQTSSWYTLYSLALVAVLGTIAVIFLSHRLYKSSKIFAIGILVTYIVIQIITLLVINALLGLVSRV